MALGPEIRVDGRISGAALEGSGKRKGYREAAPFLVAVGSREADRSRFRYEPNFQRARREIRVRFLLDLRLHVRRRKDLHADFGSARIRRDLAERVRELG